MTSAPLVSPAVLDRFARNYDEEWTNTPCGKLQREAVWRRIHPLIRPGDRVLDLGCGTGEDALHLMGKGAIVSGIDGSPEMVCAARTKGVDARVMFVENAGALPGPYDFVLSNFGVLNCIRDLSGLREPLTQLIRPGGHLAVCLMSRFCAWEFAYYASRGRFRKGVRRWGGKATSSMGMDVYYPTVRQVAEAFAPDFHFRDGLGIGIAVPPSYVHGFSAGAVRALGGIDKLLEATPLSRLADHRLLIFSRS